MASHRRLISLIYASLVSLILTCIFTRAFTDIRKNLLDQLSTFDYPRTYVELYFLMLIDSLLFLMQPWMKSRRIILIICQLIIYAYSLSKFLVFYEWSVVRKIPAYQFDRFDYLAMVFIPLFAIGGIFIWIILFSTKTAVKSERVVRMNTDESDLLLDSTEEDIEIKQSTGSWWRILKLGKPEWKLYIIGFFLLLIAASGTLILDHTHPLIEIL